MKNHVKYALASALSIFALTTISLAQSSPPAFSATASYKIGDEVTYEGVDFKCLINETTTHPSPHTTSWEISLVYSGPLTIPVGPGDAMTTLTAAWNYIADARIANNSSITISLASTYHDTFNTSFSLDHPFGARISIVGQNPAPIARIEDTPTSIKLASYHDGFSTAFASAHPGRLMTSTAVQSPHTSIIFSGGGAGFTLDTGHTLASLGGIIISAPGSGSAAQPAINVTQNACLAQLQNMTIENFDIGLQAKSGGTIDNVSLIAITGFKFGGVFAGPNSTINITSAISINAPTTGTAPQFGFYSQGGFISCLNCTASNCSNDFYATNDGKIEASGATASSSTGIGIGFTALDHSYIDAQETFSTGTNTGYGAQNSSYIDAGYSTSSKTNTSSGFDYYVVEGATIGAGNYQGSARVSTGTNDGSYVYLGL